MGLLLANEEAAKMLQAEQVHYLGLFEVYGEVFEAYIRNILPDERLCISTIGEILIANQSSYDDKVTYTLAHPLPADNPRQRAAAMAMQKALRKGLITNRQASACWAEHMVPPRKREKLAWDY